MADLTVIILTLNEEAHIERAMRSVRVIAKEIFVVDSFSTDRTVAVAQSLGAKVYQNKWTNYSQQFQWALDNLPISTAWVMRLDADEFVEPDLATELDNELATLSLEVTGLNVRCKQVFMGRWIRYGGVYPLMLLRVWRRGQALVEKRWMDEHMILLHGTSKSLKGNLCNCPIKDLTFFTSKHNQYATREAIDIINKKRALFDSHNSMNQPSSRQALRKRWMKEQVYSRLPPLFAPGAYFIYRYVILLGFLDGTEGLIYHFLQGYWYRFLVNAKVVELERALGHVESTDAQLEELSRITGYKFGGSSSESL